MIREISRAQILTKLAEGEALVFLEATSQESYNRWHIPNAVLAAAELNPAADIVIYGEDANASEPRELASRLASQGFTFLYLYRGGKKDWFDAGLATEWDHARSNPASKTG